MIVNEVIGMTKGAEKLIQDCSQWILESEGYTFFRGIQRYDEVMWDVPIRKDRNPLQTPQRTSDLINSMIHKAGLPAGRKNAIFVTSNAKDADTYGYVYAVFPKDGYQYTWSPLIKDLYVKIPYIIPGYLEHLKLYDKGFEDLPQEVLDKFEDIAVGYRSTDLRRAAEMESEVMVAGEAYHAILAKSYYKGIHQDVEKWRKSQQQ